MHKKVSSEVVEENERIKVSVRVLIGDSIEKRRLYERALKGADLEQKKILEEYERKFGY